jgi:hypothetical protein
MSDGRRFRDRAVECRALAKSARCEVDAALLEEIADEFDDEADKIEGKGHDGPGSAPVPRSA